MIAGGAGGASDSSDGVGRAGGSPVENRMIRLSRPEPPRGVQIKKTFPKRRASTRYASRELQ